MKKKFLDEIYSLRERVNADIERLVEASKQPQSGCTHCEISSADVLMAELRTRRSQLSSIDDTIQSYLTLH